MAVIEARRGKDGISGYRVRITLKGHPRVSKTFRRKTDAKRWAQSTEAAIRERRFFPGSESEKRTPGELAERFITGKLPLRAKRDQKRLRNQLEWWVEELGEATTLASVTPASIVAARDRLAGGRNPSGRPLSPATVKRYLAMLSKVMAVATKEWFWTEENPCHRVPRPSEPRGRVRFLSDEERTRLLAACAESHEPRLLPLVLVAMATGARQGELLALRWPDVDLVRRVAVLHETKNQERRKIPITGPALEILKERARLRRIDTDLVFANPKGKATMPRYAWFKALRVAEIEDFTFHDLRHTAASYLAMSGATLAEIAEVLGHKTLAMVKRYAHLTEGHTRSVVERMTRQFLV